MNCLQSGMINLPVRRFSLSAPTARGSIGRCRIGELSSMESGLYQTREGARGVCPFRAPQAGDERLGVNPVVAVGEIPFVRSCKWPRSVRCAVTLR